MTDIAGPENIDRMSGFAAGCAATYVFVRNLVMRPAIKSCHARINELEQDRERLTRRIEQLEMALFTSGIPELRKAMQGVVSEVRMEAAGKIPPRENS